MADPEVQEDMPQLEKPVTSAQEVVEVEKSDEGPPENESKKVDGAIDDGGKMKKEQEPLVGGAAAALENKMEVSCSAKVEDDVPNNLKESGEDVAAMETGSNDEQTSEEERTWDFSNRKVVIHNAPKFSRTSQIEKLLETWLGNLENIKIEKWKKPPTDPWVVLTLESADMVPLVLEHFSQHTFKNPKGDSIHATRYNKDDGSTRKRNRTSTEDQGNAKRLKSSTPKTDDEIRTVITPLWQLDYKAQLETKQKEMIKKSAIKIIQQVKAKFRTLEKEAKRNKHRTVVPVYDWVKGKRAIDVTPILPSPKTIEYRNKCEMNFGYRFENDEKIPSVGFMASGWSGGVSRPHILANIPSEACAICDIVNDFLATSPIPPYDSRAHRGLWRVLTMRTSRRTGECMIVIMHAPPSGAVGAKDETDDYSSVFESEKERLVHMLTNGDLPIPDRDYGTAGLVPEQPTEKIRVTSVFLQEYDGLSNPGPDHPVQHAFGKRTIQERLGKCTFQISPGAFFQVNTEGAEILYNVVVEKVREVCPNPQDSLLFDVCCGTGTIGLTCMKEGVVGRVVGVDFSAPAIEDAKINAKLNGFEGDERTRFVAARAEHVLSKEVRQMDGCSSVVAVVDPAREGLHPDVIKTLRVTEAIKRIVYVSCNPTTSLVRDSALLCAPPTKKYRGIAFRPTAAQPVDMFPLTTHCEMVMTFDRLEES